MHNNKYKILIIEDEDNINNLLKALLETSGYQVVSAKSCGNGQMLFASHRPDLVILDLGLPDFDGTTFLKSVRKGFCKSCNAFAWYNNFVQYDCGAVCKCSNSYYYGTGSCCICI